MKTFVIAAGAVLLAAGSAAAAVAHDDPAAATSVHDENSTAVTTHDGGREKIIIMSTTRHDRDGNRHEGADADGVSIVHCGGDRDVVERSSGDGHQRTKIVICARGQASAAARADRLEHVLSRLQQESALSDSSKAQVTAALREAIERLRSTH